MPTKIKVPVASRARPVITFDAAEGRTHQEQAAECDINRIVKRWRQTRQVVHVNTGKPFYGDFTNGTDFASVMERCHEAQQGFDDLPAEVRDACNNDPGIFLDMIQDPDALEELQELGLIAVDQDDGREPGDPVQRHTPGPGSLPPAPKEPKPPPVAPPNPDAQEGNLGLDPE